MLPSLPHLLRKSPIKRVTKRKKSVSPIKNLPNVTAPPQVVQLLKGLGLDSSSSLTSSSPSSPRNHSSPIKYPTTSHDVTSHTECSENNLSQSYMDSLRLEASPKVKRKRKVYTFIRTFDALVDIDIYVRTASKNGYKISHNNGLVKCSLCAHNHDKHDMQQQYWFCLCGDPACDLAWKINKCEKGSEWYFAQSGEFHPKEYVFVRAPGHLPKKRYGIALNVQEIYASWLKKNETLTACDLRNKLIEIRKENMNLPKDDRDPIYDFSKQLLPTLTQVKK